MPITSLFPAEHYRTTWHTKPKDGETLQDVLKNGYWAHVAARLTKGDIIEVSPEDGSYFARLIVRSLSKPSHAATEVRVELLDMYEFGKTEAKPNEYTIKFRGRARWCVMKGNVPVDTGFETEELAKEALKNHAELMAA